MSQETPTDPDVLRADIVRARADLGGTVEAIAAKLDITARAKDAVAGVTDQAKDKIRAARKQLPVAGSAVAGALVGLFVYLMWRRRP